MMTRPGDRAAMCLGSPMASLVEGPARRVTARPGAIGARTVVVVVLAAGSHLMRFTGRKQFGCCRVQGNSYKASRCGAFRKGRQNGSFTGFLVMGRETPGASIRSAGVDERWRKPP